MVVKILNNVWYEASIYDKAKPYMINSNKVAYTSYIYTLNFTTLDELEAFINSVREDTDVCFVSKNKQFNINGETYDAMTFNGYYE